MSISNDLSIYFSPVKMEGNWKTEQIGSIIECYQTAFPNIEKKGYALIYVPEFRGDSILQNEMILADNFRREFYALNYAI